MKKLLMLGFLALTAVAQADPGWLSPNMKKSDCDDVFWKTQGMCFAAFYDQQLSKLRDHIRLTISNLDAEDNEGCDRETLLEAFEAREASWDTYGLSRCELSCHCVGLCGSGHSSCYHSCQASSLGERVALLTDEVRSTLDIWGCALPLLERTKTLNTPGFEITLTATCALGFYDCGEIRYQGTNRISGQGIELTGTRIRDCDEDNLYCVWREYAFENEGIRYQIDESGSLRVLRLEDGVVLLAEEGQWE